MSLEKEFECHRAIVQIAETLQKLENFIGTDLPIAIERVSAGINALNKLAELASKTQNAELQECILKLRGLLLNLSERRSLGRRE